VLESESADIVARARHGDWRCGVPAGVETPGLMLGLAGIGYGLLRLGLPNRIPSLLSLAPPRQSVREGDRR
jgi:lantibiotic modifying enzyme